MAKVAYCPISTQIDKADQTVNGITGLLVRTYQDTVLYARYLVIN